MSKIKFRKNVYLFEQPSCSWHKVNKKQKTMSIRTKNWWNIILQLNNYSLLFLQPRKINQVRFFHHWQYFEVTFRSGNYFNNNQQLFSCVPWSFFPDTLANDPQSLPPYFHGPPKEKKILYAQSSAHPSDTHTHTISNLSPIRVSHMVHFM